MDIVEAIRIVEKTLKTPDELTFHEAIMFNSAASILAVEYVKVRQRIAPA